MTDRLSLDCLLSTGPCGMHRFTGPGYPAAYFCAECRVGSKDGTCERNKLKENPHVQ